MLAPSAAHECIFRTWPTHAAREKKQTGLVCSASAKVEMGTFPKKGKPAGTPGGILCVVRFGWDWYKLQSSPEPAANSGGSRCPPLRRSRWEREFQETRCWGGGHTSAAGLAVDGRDISCAGCGAASGPVLGATKLDSRRANHSLGTPRVLLALQPGREDKKEG